MLMNMLAPQDVDRLVDDHVARLHAPTPRPARSGTLRARAGLALITLGSALAGDVDRRADSATTPNRQAA
ncbi:MAG: hypothetical protein ABJB65_06810 [Chloroflexota bacterium]